MYIVLRYLIAAALGLIVGLVFETETYALFFCSGNGYNSNWYAFLNLLSVWFSEAPTQGGLLLVPIVVGLMSCGAWELRPKGIDGTNRVLARKVFRYSVSILIGLFIGAGFCILQALNSGWPHRVFIERESYVWNNAPIPNPCLRCVYVLIWNIGVVHYHLHNSVSNQITFFAPALVTILICWIVNRERRASQRIEKRDTNGGAGS